MLQRTLLSIALMGCPLGLARADDWPQWGGPERTGISKETGLLPSWPPKGPKLLWIFRDAGMGYSCMAVVGDRLYSMGDLGDKEYVYAIDLKTQKKLWSAEIGPHYGDGTWGNGPRSTPTIHGNYLYALGAHGDLVCVETASGKKVWSQQLKTSLGGRMGYGYCESPLVDGDVVVVTPGGEKGGIVALDKKTGTLKWRCKASIGPDCYASMIAIKAGGVRQYVQSTWRSLLGVRASDGKLLWEFERGDGTNGDVATPIYHNDCVYVSSANGGCLLLQLAPEGEKFKAKPIYTDLRMRNDHHGSVLAGEHLYGCFEKIGWVCQDFQTGKIVWKKRDPYLGDGSVLLADGNLYGYHERKGDVLLIKVTPTGYQEQGRFRIPKRSKLLSELGRIWTHPVVANGRLYLRDQDLIFCYDIRKTQ